MISSLDLSSNCPMSPSPRRAWIEIYLPRCWTRRTESPSPRRARIEIYCGRCSYQYEPVALPTEGADRNYGRNAITGNLIVVALPTEDVDRITARVARRASNSPHPDTLRPGKAAWRENCPAGWGHPALRGDKKSLCGIQPGISPSSGAFRATFPPRGRLSCAANFQQPSG